MEFHYTVIYDDKVNAWSVEPDPSMYYPDGNIYDRNVFPGWSFPEEGSHEETLDHHLLNTLQYIVDTLPTPAQQEA